MLLIEAIKDGSVDGLHILSHLWLSMRKTETILRLFVRFIMENKAYFYVLECADGSLYTGYTTTWRSGLLPIIVGKGPNTPADACLSAYSIKKLLLVKGSHVCRSLV